MKFLGISSEKDVSPQEVPMSVDDIDSLMAAIDAAEPSTEEPVAVLKPVNTEVEKETLESETAKTSDNYWTEADIDRWLDNSALEKRHRAKGYADVRRGSVIMKDFQGRAFAFEIDVYNKRQEDFEKHWVTLDVVQGHCVYTFSLTGENIGTVPAASDFTESWLREANAGIKVVKSRPPNLYQEFFRLPKKEVGQFRQKF